MAIVGYWRLNGNSDDASGNEYHGNDDITYSSTNGLNGCMINNASNQELSLSHSLGFGSTGTISLRYNFTTNGGIQCLFDTSPDLHRYFFYFNGTSANLYMNQSFVLSSFALPYTNGVWNNLVFTWDTSLSSEKLKVYINGQMTTSANTNFGTYSITTVFFGANSFGSQPFVGLTDECKIFNSYLFPGQIKNEYLRVKGFF